MRILWLQTLNMAVFASEEQETPEGDLLTVQITDPQGNGVEAELRIGGHTCSCHGRAEIHMKRLPPGRYSVFLKGMEGSVFVGSLETNGRTVKPLPDASYTLTVRALAAWEDARIQLKSHEERIRTLEKSAHGVDLMNLK